MDWTNSKLSLWKYRWSIFSELYRTWRSGYGNQILDEFRIDNVARSAQEIRQAYEIEKRSHPVTIDFAANLDAGNVITNSSDLSFTVDATKFGLSQPGDKLFVGDKIIVREIMTVPNTSLKVM